MEREKIKNSIEKIHEITVNLESTFKRREHNKWILTLMTSQIEELKNQIEKLSEIFPLYCNERFYHNLMTENHSNEEFEGEEQ